MAVRFDAASDRLSYSASSPPTPNSGFTITLWAYVSVSRGDYSTLVRLWTGSDSNVPVTFDTDSDGLTGPQYFSTSGIVNGSLGMAVGAWRKLAVTRNSSGTAKNYAATQVGVTQVSSGAIGSIPDPIGVTLAGRTPAEANEWFNGRLAYVRVWSRELSQTEIETEWSSTVPVSVTGLWAAWPLESASDLTDHSGNGRTLVADATEGPTAVTTEAGPFPIAATAALTAATSVTGTATIGTGATATLVATTSISASGMRELPAGVSLAAATSVTASGDVIPVRTNWVPRIGEPTVVATVHAGEPVLV
jgi:hypothetical protein